MSATEIMLERDTANDESAIVVKIHVLNGEPVGEDTLLFDIENSKAVQEVWSTSAGVLKHELAIGQTVEFGVPIARIVPAGEVDDAPAPTPKPVAAVLPPAPQAAPPIAPKAVVAAAIPMAAASPSSAPSRRLTEPRYSRAASALIAEHALTGVDFDVDFVTTREVRAHLGMPQLVPAPPPAATPRKTPELVSGSKAGRAVENRKRSEIDALTRGAGDTMLSVLGVTLGPLEIRRAAGDFLAGSITDLVIYEASRLMKKYPNLNAAYADGYVVEHEAIHAGMAIDGGGKLVVYGIENANRLEMQELSNAMADAVERYTNNALTSAEMTRATFTVTDLSADELDFIFPLLPRGQSCILGITHSAAGGFRIFAGFDHRVTEGREIAAFLGELRTRLLTFAAAQKAAAPAANCGYCGRSADEAVKGKEKGLLKVIVRDGGEVLCCASCWSGW